MSFRTLPPGLAARLIRNHTDELTPVVEKQQAYFDRTPCGRCGSAMEATVYGQKPFRPDHPLARTVGRCPDCGYTIDPATNLVLDTGDPSKIEDALPLLRKTEE